MTRPEIIRADSIDLQDRDNPSAQRHPARPSPLKTAQSASGTGTGNVAPHQAETIREVAAEQAEEELRSPRVSWTNGGTGDIQQYAEDLAANVTNSLNAQSRNKQHNRGGEMAANHQDDLVHDEDLVSHDDIEDADLDGDEGDLDDDDMMDKISSSPSIDDEAEQFTEGNMSWQGFKEEQTDIDEAVGLEDEIADSEDLLVPYEGSTDEDDDDDLPLESQDPRFVDSGWGGECLHDTEDIDFELVYALHTFIATVEGQANATKGDAMLSAAMLGDQSDKTKNPIKTAVRRRKARNVTFAAPTYVDYSDFDYSSEEEDAAEAEIYAQKQAAIRRQTIEEGADGDESAQVAPLRPRSQQKSAQAGETVRSDADGDSSPSKGNRSSEEIFETNGVDGPKRRADGTVRDSFFKDDTVETKKITLTPNLLRDDGTVRGSTDSDKGVRQRPSFDTLLERELREDKKGKDKDKDKEKEKEKDKKEKEKKGGFRSLFSRRDKRSKSIGEEDSAEKRSMEVVVEAAEREPEDANDDHSADKMASSPQRSPGKLQKQHPRVEPPATRKPEPALRESENPTEPLSFKNEAKLKNVSNVPPASMRIVEPEPQDVQDDVQKSRAPDAVGPSSGDDDQQGASIAGSTRSQKIDEKSATSRMELDDSESDSGVDDYDATIRQMPAPNSKPQEQPQTEKPRRPTIPGAFPDSYISTQSAQSDSTITEGQGVGATQQGGQERERLSDSPIQVSPITPSGDKLPGLMGDNSSQEDHSSPVSSQSPSPELIDRDEAGRTHRNQDSITTSTSTTTVSTWNDTSLRAFFDSGSDIRDLLVVVYDKTDVEPVGPDHPVAGTLFKEQNAKLAEITTQLDNMLGDWLARKQRLRGTV
ncbi:hypothetical protein VPNG_00742 [Cytospora leucostoma]|uniref:Uncharacterized protein n=1 Tax=Cytospora leucostoma TaxID=1230097 RepID=A0A423XNN3_9PEZI|nr:hypothetical protein VPNG_00742 [Cytospora leucostoma]